MTYFDHRMKKVTEQRTLLVFYAMYIEDSLHNSAPVGLWLRLFDLFTWCIVRMAKKRDSGCCGIFFSLERFLTELMTRNDLSGSQDKCGLVSLNAKCFLSYLLQHTLVHWTIICSLTIPHNNSLRQHHSAVHENNQSLCKQ